MKKIFNMIMAGALCLSLAACGTSEQGVQNETKNDEQTIEQKVTEEAGEITEQGATKETTVPETEEQNEITDAEEGSTLVVYFSNTGNTKAIAEHIANGLSADLYEIVAADPYTEVDLNYNDNNSRSTLEMNDSSARPAISGTVDNMEQYDTIYIPFGGEKRREFWIPLWKAMISQEKQSFHSVPRQVVV